MTSPELNKENQLFWDKAGASMTSLMEEDPSAFEEVVNDWIRDSRHWPVHHQKPLEQMVIRAATYIAKHQSDFSRRGGKAKKTDELNRLIEGIVRKNPDITCPDLLTRLRTLERIPSIVEIDEESITLFGGKIVWLSGLKDRLSRAKKKIRTRETC